MKKTAGLVMVIFLVAALHIHAQDRGLKVVAGENLGQQANIGKQYALFIAIDAYRNWPALKKPVADAREIRDILRQDYYIDEVIELYNQSATRANIARTFTDLQSKLGVHDSLFIYYAGHGHYDASSNAGFWIPIDGGTDQFAQENWLPNSQIRGYISRFKTIHVFMVSDACFSGDILNTSRALPPQIDNAYFRRAYALTSRQVLTSGASEEVPDQSEFSAALINCLRKNTSPLLDPNNIYDDVKLSVRKTLPLLGTLEQSGHQNGATFLFFRRSSSIAQPAPAPVVQPAAPPQNPAPDNFVGINGGTFTMGSPANEPGRGSDEVQHQVTVGSFYMGKYEVTQKEWYDVMGTTVRQQRDKEDKSWSMYGEGDNYPMYYVNWFDAVEYCNKRSQREGLTPAYTINGTNVTWNRNATGYRLPTEAEWEYACRAGTTKAYNTGASISGDTGWYYINSGSTSHPVGQKPANRWGLHDMHGNVLEWCWDWYGSYSSGAQTDPMGASSGSNRVYRGGSWCSVAGSVRSAGRFYNHPSYRDGVVGFRLVRNYKPAWEK